MQVKDRKFSADVGREVYLSTQSIEVSHQVRSQNLSGTFIVRANNIKAVFLCVRVFCAGTSNIYPWPLLSTYSTTSNLQYHLNERSVIQNTILFQ